jgi:DEAD/DEAH box helicase domain-containing protein
MKTQDLMQRWWSNKAVAPNLCAYRTVSARDASVSPLPSWTPEGLALALEARGISQLWSHQREAADAARAGRNVCLVTPTASGKTLAYNLPILKAIADDPGARALYLFPTKALAQDQYHEFLRLAEAAGIPAKVHTFDGDTPSAARAAVKEHGNAVMTNPDMLHSGILPHHATWMKLFSNLRYVVIDEVHSYRGVFGSHLANVLRRLKRIAAFHGSKPVFILCSATIGNPAELAAGLIDDDVVLVDKNGSPSGLRHVLLYNPPIVNRELGLRGSTITHARRLAMDALEAGLSSIVFAGSRLKVELLLKYLREEAEKRGLPPAWVQSYRGGYLPDRRRAIEKGIREGAIRCVVTTNALELGIDIGSLDLSLVVGYPGTQAGLWQQWGRAGRRLSDSLSVLVGSSAATDQFMLGNPDFLLGRRPELALIDPDNPYILMDHLKCAAFELPFHDGSRFGPHQVQETSDMLELLRRGGLLHHSGGRFTWTSDVFPAASVSLRNIPGENFVVIDQDREKIVAEVDFVSAHTVLHEGAIHNVEGEQYLVKRLDYPGRKAYVERSVTDYYTDAETHVEVKLLSREDEGPALRGHGEASVTERVVGYKKIRFYSNENVGYGEVNLPELTMHTTTTWLQPPADLLATLPCTPDLVMDTLRGLTRVLKAMASLRLMCDLRDLGSTVVDHHELPDLATSPDQFSPAMYFYDWRPGGVGLSPRLWTLFPEVLEDACTLIADCPCAEGCPSCIGAGAGGAGPQRKELSLTLGRLLGQRLEHRP